MENITKISDTQFSRPAAPEIIDVVQLSEQRKFLIQRLQNIQDDEATVTGKIADIDALIAAAAKIGVAVPAAEQIALSASEVIKP